MIVKDIMSSNVITVNSNELIINVLHLMRECNLGFIVITNNKEILGVITDRDIVISLSKNYKLTDEIGLIMKKHVITINLNSDINDASDLLGNMQIKRLVVVNDSNKICGVLSLCDIAREILLEDNALEALTEISYDFTTKNDNVFLVDIKML